MKNKYFLLFLFGVLFLNLQTQAQSYEDRLVQSQVSCDQISLRSSELFPYYMEAGLIDSAGFLLNIWNDKCGSTEPVFRANLLMVLKMHYYTDELINTFFFDMMNIYETRLTLINNNEQFIYNYNHAHFDYVPVGGVFDTWSQNMAADLLEYYSPGETEYLICLFYSGQTALAYKLILEQPYASSAPGLLYANKLNEALRLPMLHLGFYAGTWIPEGQLSRIGIHPELGITYGVKVKENSFDLVMGIKFIKAPTEYKALRHKFSEPEYTDYFFGGYIGLEYSRDLLNFKPYQTYVTIGAAYDGFNMLEEDEDAGLDLSSANSYNFNIGLGTRVLLFKNNYLNMGIRYNLVDYTLNDKFFMKGNVYTVRLSYQFFSNTYRENLLNTLHYDY
ncbi:MAG: hypothetical protein KUL83_04705 [Lentimicrobium sp.]|jgi:hypothetical protein|nr:hypothetical protein [Lentimicrobium sp.]MDD2526847.1 hypothetical protein [Lentimicrobiaceae bacterium]MDD4599006.1 hypothetical protein [Lentimicrobiaceae bacterium]MDY0027072.1 hypothetical protein [Lentimicrobium sp.]HAH56935.1 hypothetical protein [Bacteroidales bacterium]